LYTCINYAYSRGDLLPIYPAHYARFGALLRLCLSFISAASFYRSSSKATNQRWGTISWQQQKGDMFSDAPGGVDINPNKNINIFWIAWQISYHNQSPINNFTPSRILTQYHLYTLDKMQFLLFVR